MTTYISLLRGINVSGRNMIRMQDLKLLYEDLGFKNVETYIQSGNVVFTSDKNGDPDVFEKRIEEAIKARFGLTVPVIIRTLDEMQYLSLNNPFFSRPGMNTGKLYITYLKNIPETDKLEGIREVKHPPDEYIISGKDIFIHCPDRYGETKLSNAFFEGKLKVSATTRNWKTLCTLIQTGKQINAEKKQT